jgi:hypothetical protein
MFNQIEADVAGTIVAREQRQLVELDEPLCDGWAEG